MLVLFSYGSVQGIDASYLRDLPIPPREAKGQPYAWLDHSLSGVWTVGFGNFDRPEESFVPALWTPSHPLRRFGFLSRNFQVDGDRLILPGASRYSQSAIIRWEANLDGVVDITGRIVSPAKTDPKGRMKIFLENDSDSRVLWESPYPPPGGSRTIDGPALQNLPINKGDTIFFVATSKNPEHGAFYFGEEDFSIRTGDLDKVVSAGSTKSGDYYPKLSDFSRRTPPAVLSIVGKRISDPKVGEDFLEGNFSYGGQTGSVLEEDGVGIDWNGTGPGDDTQWTGALNRHLELVAAVHHAIGNDDPDDEKRAAEILIDWIESNPFPYPDESPEKHTPQIIPESPIPWYTLHAAIRLRSWAILFDPLVKSGALSDREFQVFVDAIREHMALLRWHHREFGNWKVTEMHSLALASLVWHEFPESEEALRYAMREMFSEAFLQVYPDGVQKELTPMYHYIVLGRFDEFRNMIELSGRTMPAQFENLVESMWNSIAYMMRPDGALPQLNNSDLTFVRETLMRKAKEYDRGDWAWLASGGLEGIRPENPPSTLLPWAGILVSRDAWPPEQTVWSAFDIGPWGMAHQHNDFGHLSLYAHGRSILVDPGRYTYSENDPLRSFFTHSRSHNVLMVDDRGQNPHDKLANTPLTDENVRILMDGDTAKGIFEAGYGSRNDVVTQRDYYFDREGKWWLLRDSWKTDREENLSLTVSWNFHPDCAVLLDNGAISTIDAGKGNLQIFGLSSNPISYEIEKGNERTGGWYSESYGKIEPATRVVANWEGSSSGQVFWLITTIPNFSFAAETMVQNEDESTSVTVVSPEGKLVTIRFLEQTTSERH